jgi:hypothetical protein
MNKHSVKCITSLQLTLAEKTKTRNADHATSDVVISQPLSRTKETCVRKHAIHAKHKWLGGCAVLNALLSPSY